LREGQVLVHEPLASLRARAQSRLRLAARQGPAALVAAVRRRGLSAEPTDDDGVMVPLDDPVGRAPDLLRALLTDGLDVYACAPVLASLEELFLDVVGKAR